jgi:SWI/SNF-related matrix-associated actin-dependent regulator 1 of chromatin subfamily A
MTTHEEHKYQPLFEAICSIADRCDGAVTQDGTGFNGGDAKFGKRMSQTPVIDWSYDQACDVYVMLRTYRGQLSARGINFDVLVSPGDSYDRCAGRDLARAQEYARKNQPYVEMMGSTILVLKSFQIKDDLKSNGFAFDPRHVNSKAWEAPLNAQTAATVIRLGVSLTDAQREIFEAQGEFTPEIEPETETVHIDVCRDHPSSLRRGTVGTHLTLSVPYGTIPLAITRALPARQWDHFNKCDHIDPNLKIYILAEEYGLNISDDAKAMIETTREQQEHDDAVRAELVAESFATDTNTQVALSEFLRNYQRAGTAYQVTRRKTLNSDEMGLGKTLQSLAAVETTQAYPCLIVTPASLCANWAREIKRWLPHRQVVVQSGRAGGWELPEVDIRIMSYNVAESYIPYLYKLASVICDEAHFIKEHKSKRTQAVMQICGKAVKEVTDKTTGRKTFVPLPGLVKDDPMICMLTGTPILNRPKELIPLLLCLGHLTPESGKENSVGWFLYRFCAKRTSDGKVDTSGWGGKPDFNGAENLDELHVWLRQTCMVGRLKTDVLDELPDKMSAPQFIALDERAQAIYDKLAEEGAEKAAKSSAEALVYMNALRSAVGTAKAQMALEWAVDFIESSGKKLVIYAHHKSVQNHIIGGLRDAHINVASILGAQSPRKTEAAKAEFQEGDAQVIVCSLAAAGYGHTLTAASDMLIVEQGWNPGTQDQAEDRIHRIGQTMPVTIYYLIAQDTFDDDMYEIVEYKRGITQTVNRGLSVQDDELSVFTTVLDRTLSRVGKKRGTVIERTFSTVAEEKITECDQCGEINLCSSAHGRFLCLDCA